MSDVVSMAQAEIAALVDLLRERTEERDVALHERDEARALLARLRTSLSERHDDPASDGSPERAA